MSESNTRTISILTHQTQGATESMLPFPNRIITKCYEVGYTKLKESLSDFVNTLDDIVEALPKSRGDYELDSVTFALSMDGSGKISLIGELSAGITSGITITIKKKVATK